jgi:predicted small integral membrane protein
MFVLTINELILIHLYVICRSTIKCLAIAHLQFAKILYLMSWLFALYKRFVATNDEFFVMWTSRFNRDIPDNSSFRLYCICVRELEVVPRV